MSSDSPSDISPARSPPSSSTESDSDSSDDRSPSLIASSKPESPIPSPLRDPLSSSSSSTSPERESEPSSRSFLTLSKIAARSLIGALSAESRLTRILAWQLGAPQKATRRRTASIDTSGPMVGRRHGLREFRRGIMASAIDISRVVRSLSKQLVQVKVISIIDLLGQNWPV